MALPGVFLGVRRGVTGEETHDMDEVEMAMPRKFLDISNKDSKSMLETCSFVLDRAK